MQTPHHIESGLNDLSLFPHEPRRQNSFCRSFSSLLPHRDSSFGLPYHSSHSSSFSSSSMIGDYIGMESCVDILSDGDQLELLDRGRAPAASTGEREIRHRRSSSASGLGRGCRRKFPPPIPSLAQTENLHARMPWVLRRHYTGDGRLILTEEKVRHHEYFRAHRSNGRLTLHLVPLDGAVLAPPLADEREEEGNNIEDDHNDHDQEEGDGGVDDRDRDCDEVDGGDEDDQVEEESCKDNKNGNEGHGIGSGSGSGSGSGGKCYNYSGGRFILGFPVPAIRPVHS